MSSDDRYSGFLTADDRDWLRDDNRKEEGPKARRIRKGIRERAGRALRDFSLLESKLPDKGDPGGIFRSFGGLWTDEGLSHYPMRDALAFLYRASRQHDYSHLDWQKWIKRAIRRVEPAAYVDVEIHVLQDHHIDQLHETYRDDPDQLDKAHLRALMQEGRIDPGELADRHGPILTAFPPEDNGQS